MIKLQSERCFRALIEKSSDAVLLVDAAAIITYANPSAGKLLGHDPQRIVSMTVLDLIHPNDREFIEKSLTMSENDGGFSGEVRLQYPDGSWLWLECATTNLLQEPEVEGVFLTFRDITGRKEAQHNLQTQRDLLLNLPAMTQATGEAALRNAQLYDEAQSNLADLSALIESSQDGLILISPEGQTRVINTAAMKMVGLSGDPSQWMYRPIVDLLRRARRSSPQLVKLMIAEVGRVRAGDDLPAGGEIRSLPHFIKWVHMPIVQNERILGRLVVLHDITDQNKLFRQREELTDMIVHDLRNPASAVAGIVSMLKSLKALDEIPEDFEQMMQLAERNVSKILELVQEILDVSQLENGQLPVKKEPVQLIQLIEDTLQLQRPIISMKEMNLEANIQPDLPDVWADERLIRRVLQNLVDNAAKFSRRQSNITLAAQVSQENSDWVQVSVQDYGVGIPTEMKNLVFEKFVTNRHTQRGSGIGLTFCRLAVEAHDGRIWAESEENLGSTFYFTLPIA